MESASQAGVVALLDTLAARTGRAAELLAEAAALRAAVPRLSRLAWLPADAEGDWKMSCTGLQHQGFVGRRLQVGGHLLSSNPLTPCVAGRRCWHGRTQIRRALH